MPPALSTECKDRIQQHLFDGLSPTAIADIEGYTPKAVRKYKNLIETYGTYSPKSHTKQGPPYKLFPVQ